MFPGADLGVLRRYMIGAKAGAVDLAGVDPQPKPEPPFADKAEAEAATRRDVDAIDRLQDVLYAQAKHALLVIMQGMDTSGKDGAIRKVFGPVDPLGIVATSFKKPTELERSHDFLWRIHKAVPPAGMIGVFNRSHYEDVLVPRVHGLMPPDQIEARYEQINMFEKHLSENGVTILKFFLHISGDEQKERLQARLDEPAKRWKFNPGDLEERKHWNAYMAAYGIALERCGTEWAPWFIIPANRKWYRTAIIARIVRSTLEAMDLTYPPAMPGLDRIRVE